MKKIWKGAAVILAAAMTLTGCGASSGSSSGSGSSSSRDLSYDDAKTELSALVEKVGANEVRNPHMDINADETSQADALADLDASYELVVKGSGQIDIEVAAATETSSDAPDDWLIVCAKAFNRAGYTIGGKSVSVSIRKITSGETLTYVTQGGYEPECFVPSNYAWGEMLKASGIEITKVADRIAGNTAGVLIKQSVYDTFEKKYGEANAETVTEAAIAGDLTLGYANPYTSSTGLNFLTAVLYSFDPDNPLSEKATKALQDYQRTTPPVAYTTAVLRNQAARGVIDAMVMEEQAYTNSSELRGYVYVPIGIRHDHPVYSFGWDTDEEKQAVEEFAKFCQTDEMQEEASDRGFNKHDDYVGQDPGLNGSGYLSAQKLWKQSKNGGNPMAAVFVADVSGSMSGTPLKSLKESLTSAMQYIGQDNYVGLVSYSDDVTINLPLAQFDAKQRAYFSGEVKALSAGGGTATYDAVLVALDMLEKLKEEDDTVKTMVFVLTDGAQNKGFSLSRVTPVVGGLKTPVYAIAYNYADDGSLETLSGENEATVINADSDNVVNQLRNLFNVEL